MSARVGLAVARDAVRAVALRRRRIVWAAEVPLEQRRGLEETIGALLAEAPLPRWPRPILSAAVGPHAAQVKLVGGLPDVADAATLAAIVREGAGSFFLKNGVPLVTTGVRPAGTGVAMAAALDLPCVEAIRNACRARGWRLAQIAPTAVALILALEDEHLVWTDGAVVLEITRAGGRPAVESVRTRPACAADTAGVTARPVPVLATLGEGAVGYADAFGATALGEGEPLTLNALTAGLLSRSEVQRPFIAPLLILGAAVAFLVLSPLAARWAGERADARLAAVRPGRWQVILTALGQLDRATRVLDEAGAFAASRSSVTDLLGGLTRALPDGSALTSLELDGDRGQLETLTQQPADVLAAIKRVRSVTAAELVGPVKPEPVGGRDIQRVTIRFRLAPGWQPPNVGGSR